jgi:hypothetical protein
VSTIILRPDPVRSNPLPFAPLPHVVNEDPRIKHRAVRVANAILKHARAQASCHPSNRQLAAACHCGVRTVQYALAELRDAGWLRIEQGPDGRVIRLTWREGPPCNGLQDPLQPAAAPPCNGLQDPLQPAAAPPCNGLHPKKKEGEREERNVTDVPLPEGNAPPPGRPRERPPAIPTASGSPQPVRPILAELKALPGAEPPRVRSLAWRLAHHLRDVASVGFFVMVLGLVAQRLEPVERLLAAFHAADRSRGKARKPGAIFASTWTGWQPPPLPSAINRPAYYQAPRPADRPPPGPAPAAPVPHEVAPPAVAPPRIAPPPSAEEIRRDQIRTWRAWESIPRHPMAGIARRNLAACSPEELAGEGP